MIKRIITIIILLTCFLVVPSCNNRIISTNLQEFSYEEILKSLPEDYSGFDNSKFVNISEKKVDNESSAFYRAKNECTIKYDSYNISYDKVSKMWEVCFYKKDVLGGDQSIYISDKGITTLIIYGK